MSNKLSAKEFIEHGYLQEVNRQFFHPLGLALAVNVDLVDGVVTEQGDLNGQFIVRILDSRDDPEGFIFGPDMLDEKKFLRVHGEFLKMGVTRLWSLGYIVQPVTRKE